MAKGLNRVQLLGHMGKTAEIRATGGGMTVATFTFATAEREKRGNEWVDATEWHSVVAFGKLAEIIQKYTTKGSKLLIEGRLRTRSWDDKDSGQKRYRTEVIASDVTLLDSRGAGAKQATDEGYEMHPAVTPGEITDDDIPF